MEEAGDDGGCWTDLPPDMLHLIFGDGPIDKLNLRWVCRSWRRIALLPTPNSLRISRFLPPTHPNSFTVPPNILSPIFPLRRSSSIEENLRINAAAVYLLRPRSDPSKVRMVSVQELVAGELKPGHALGYDHQLGAALDLDHWISATQICRWYECRGETDRGGKVGLVANPSGSGLVGLWESDLSPKLKLLAFGLEYSSWTNSGEDIKTASPLVSKCDVIKDFVKFHGRICAVDDQGYFNVLNEADMKFDRVTYGKRCVALCSEQSNWMRLVVSDGGLYLVMKLASKCLVYRWLGKYKKGRGWEEVEDLGDRVFFFARNCSFSVSARDLPSPWRGNCVLFTEVSARFGHQIRVYHLGKGDDHAIKPISALQGYSDLLSSIDS